MCSKKSANSNFALFLLDFDPTLVYCSCKVKKMRNNTKIKGGTEMKKMAALGILAIMLFVSTSEAFAHWKPVVGTIVHDPAPIFDGITEK
jgi:hypothetical protein